MKKTHIIAIVLLAVAAAIIFSTGEEASEYVNFEKALKLSKQGKSNNIHVVGELKKDSAGNILGMKYDPVQNPNYFEFVLIDEQKKEETVYYFAPKPADLDKSEKIVVIGSYNKKEKFVIDQILLKCPSKYPEQQKNLKE